VFFCYITELHEAYLSDLQLKDMVTLYITYKQRRGSKQMVARWIIVADFEYKGGPGSSACIATDYGLDGPGPNPGGDECC